ncbi:hypothetical protein H2201_005058 [Coniosporium apollinis]|uniref:Uncharacterized protein n=1 Tax=Coniosporium apollinis TaxID=61459 RepID=A0ABQ9NXI2_9PEZI|nr:hypothetical protein H2201_005058 [Coniosporium apollinis]
MDMISRRDRSTPAQILLLRDARPTPGLLLGRGSSSAVARMPRNSTYSYRDSREYEREYRASQPRVEYRTRERSRERSRSRPRIEAPRSSRGSIGGVGGKEWEESRRRSVTYVRG